MGYAPLKLDNTFEVRKRGCTNKVRGSNWIICKHRCIVFLIIVQLPITPCPTFVTWLNRDTVVACYYKWIPCGVGKGIQK